jgi:catechol 2,3-dioxygenase-like lactoylglutathione lyase family enzyme
MAYHQGRLIDHIHLRVRDLEQSKTFYRAVLKSLGRSNVFGEGNGYFYADELYIDQATDYVSRVHLAFQARDREAVDQFYEAAIASGGTDNGAPDLRDYHQQYYAAFVFDPDGNNIEAVCDAPTQRSSDSVVVERLEGFEPD